MDRRNFIKNVIGASITGSAVISGLYSNQLFGNPVYDDLRIDIPSPHLTKLKMKPIMTSMYHTDVWEGPCRFNVRSPEEEKKRAKESFNSFSKDVKNNTFGIDKSNAQLMDPELILHVEDFEIQSDQYRKIEKEANDADVLFIAPGGSSIATYNIAKRYNKPVIFSWGLNCRTVDIAAYCRSKGLEVYVPHTEEETNEIIGLLRARKVFGQTRILYPTDWKWPSVASVAGINDPKERLKEKFGIDLVPISYEELAKEMDKTRKNEAMQEDAREMAEVMYKNADRTFLDKKYVARSMEFYKTIIRLMQQHNCNAFTIECFEFCVSRLPQKWQITPCLVHTLFKDLGIPSACEGDLGGLLSMHMLMSISRKSSHMGNMFYRENGKMEVNHSAPGIKMRGHNKAGLPYQLGNFVESGWGTKAVVDFMKNSEKDVTVARMNPEGTGLLVLKGKLVDSNGWDEDLLGCSVSAYIVGEESGTAEEFMEKQADYGNHLVWVYGDYADKLKKLGKLINVEVEVVS